MSVSWFGTGHTPAAVGVVARRLGPDGPPRKSGIGAGHVARRALVVCEFAVAKRLSVGTEVDDRVAGLLAAGGVVGVRVGGRVQDVLAPRPHAQSAVRPAERAALVRRTVLRTRAGELKQITVILEILEILCFTIRTRA